MHEYGMRVGPEADALRTGVRWGAKHTAVLHYIPTSETW